MIKCTNCSQPYPENGVPFLCPHCGGLYEIIAESYQNPPLNTDPFSGFWRYKSNFELPDNAAPISLGEGNTPLIWCEIDDRQYGFKCEFLNPHGSYKDRGAALLASFLKARGIKRCNRRLIRKCRRSLAAYAARAGIHAQIYVPEAAAGPKITQMKAYGAEVFPIKGSREDVALAVLEMAKGGTCYASHAYLPQVMLGYATIAYELVEQLGDAPGSIILPVGQGNLLLGIGCGFKSMLKSRNITHLRVSSVFKLNPVRL
jgi:threonine synthase